MKKRIVLRNSISAYVDVCQFLHENLGFEIITLNDEEISSIRSKQESISDFIKDSKVIFKKLSILKNAEIILCIGNLNTLLLMIFNRIHMIRPGSLLWWGFFIHSPKVQRVLRSMLKVLYSPNIKYILFSQCEINMYREQMGLLQQSMLAIPYGDWGNETIFNSSVAYEEEDYYFSGGYSNRDYKALLESWQRNFPRKRLVVIGSRNNDDLIAFTGGYWGNTIQVLFDVSPEVFEKYLRKSKAVVLPFKYNTGASGQSVMLRCMRNRKIVIAKDTNIMREYMTDKETGFLINNYDQDLIKAICKIEADESYCEKLKEAQQKLFQQRFSYECITGELKKMIESL